MSKAFCGIGQVPKNKIRGSMKDCAELGQIRYYGLKKVDTKLINNSLKNKNSKKGSKDYLSNKLAKLYIEMAGLKGTLKRLNRVLDIEKDKAVKEKAKNDIEKTEKKLKKVLDEISSIKNETKNKIKISRTKTTNKKTSKNRKASKQTSKNRKTSKKRKASFY
jgi:hypothetical protein